MWATPSPVWYVSLQGKGTISVCNMVAKVSDVLGALTAKGLVALTALAALAAQPAMSC